MHLHGHQKVREKEEEEEKEEEDRVYIKSEGKGGECAQDEGRWGISIEIW